MRRLALCFALLLTLAPRLALAEGPGLVTVIGTIGQTNRGPLDPFADALLANYVTAFEKAYVFDAAALAALPQASLKRTSDNWNGQEHVFTGPPLAAVLQAVGATGGKITVTAIDGYFAEFTLAEVRDSGMLLATAIDGQQLAVGGRGPAHIAFQPGSVASLAADKTGDSGMVWAAILITVE